jgi:hypothetical protein
MVQTQTVARPTFTPTASGVLQRQCACGQHTSAGGECAECKKKRESTLQRAANNPSPLHDVPPIVREVLRSPGQPLDAATRTFMEPRVRHDFSHIPVQAKLTVGTPDDRYEQEADRMAEQVVQIAGSKMPAEIGASHPLESPPIQRSCTSCFEAWREGNRDRIPIMTKGLSGANCESGLGRDQEEEEETSAMAKAMSGELHKPNQSLEHSLAVTRDGGGPLSNETRSFMGSRFGHDFSSVRVHTDHRAASMTEQLHAEAFTSGRDIYFRAGRYDPLSLSGKRLLAHELTHVIQQGAKTSARCAAANDNSAGINHIQRFSLNGFPPTEEAAMKAAVPVAISKVKSCSELSWYGKRDIPIALNSVRYDYVPDLGLCGWTFPTAWYIEVGKDAFNKGTCCDLPSTLAHEAAHTVFYTESRARKMECHCFNCSC